MSKADREEVLGAIAFLVFLGFWALMTVVFAMNVFLFYFGTDPIHPPMPILFAGYAAMLISCFYIAIRVRW